MSSQGNTFRSGYKKRSFCFGDNDGKRVLRADRMNEDRKDRRRNAFQTRRFIEEETSPTDTCVLKEVSSNANRSEALKRWKREKEDRLKVLKKRERPAFKVSVVKHKVYSPPVCFCNKENCRSALCAEAKLKVKRENKAKLTSCVTPLFPKKPTLLSSSSQKQVLPVVDSGRGRRLQPQLEKTDRLALPLTPRPQHNVKKEDKLKIFATPKLTSRLNQPSSSRKKVLPKVDSGMTKRAQPQAAAVSAAACVDQPAKNNAEESLESQGQLVTEDSREEGGDPAGAAPPSDNSRVVEQHVSEPASAGGSCEVSQDREREDVDYPAMHSPYITVARGKNRRDTPSKACSSPGVFSSTPTRYLQNLSNMLSAAEEDHGVHGVKYFRLKLKLELGLLHTLCDYWSAVQKLDEATLEDSTDLVDSAVGQCKLLMTKKMAQFDTLITNCEQQSGERSVTVDDLQGFWDVINMQVVDVRKRFNNLEGLYLNDGEKNVATLKKKTTRKSSRNKKNIENEKPKVGVKSSMRAMIAAARKKQKEESSAEADTAGAVIETQPVPATPSRVTPRARSASLHQQVLVRESRRKTVTWEAASPVTSSKEESLPVPTRTATPKSAMKRKSLTLEKEKSDERPKDVSSVHFEDAEVTDSLSKTEYSLTPYVRRNRRSRYSSTPKNAQVTENSIGLETPSEEPARVRRSKRFNSTGL